MESILTHLSQIPILEGLAIFILSAILPLMALSYFFFRSKQRQIEIGRILFKLEIQDDFRKVSSAETTLINFLGASGLAMIVSIAGLTVLLLGAHLKLADEPNLLLGGANLPSSITLEKDRLKLAQSKQQAKSDGSKDNNQTPSETEKMQKYQQTALLVFGMAFFGAYLWGVQNIFRRYSMNDLIPGAYYGLTLRLVFASAIAMLIYHTSDALSGGFEIDGHSTNLLPAIAFLVGMFPQRALQWLMSKISIIRKETNPAVQELPLEMIEGISMYDRVRLEELGIDSCYDLSNADFIPLLLKTPYGARELIDWLLQAKLCIRFGDSVKCLRERGIRTILDLEHLKESDILQLSKETRLTEKNLLLAKEVTSSDEDIIRLCAAAKVLSKYWDYGDIPQPTLKDMVPQDDIPEAASV